MLGFLLLFFASLLCRKYEPAVSVPLEITIHPERAIHELKRLEILNSKRFNDPVDTRAKVGSGVFTMTADVQDILGNNYKVLLDTGSSDLLLMSNACGSECQGSNKYNPSATNAAPFDCSSIDIGFRQSCTGQAVKTNTYAQGTSVTSTYWYDSIQFSTATTEKIQCIIGQITTQTGSQLLSPDGIFGLGFSPRSRVHYNSPIFTILNNGNFYPAFRLTMNKTIPTLILGQDDVDYEGMTFFQVVYLTGAGGFDWALYISQISVNGTKVYGYTSALFDSGSSAIYLQQPIFEAVKASMLQQCTTNSISGCSYIFNAFQQFSMTLNDVLKLPSFSIYLSNQEYIVGPLQYLYPVNSDNSKWLPVLSSAPSNSDNIMGASFMQGYVMSFDVSNAQIGLAYPPGVQPPETIAPIPIPEGASPGLAPPPRPKSYGDLIFNEVPQANYTSPRFCHLNLSATKFNGIDDCGIGAYTGDCAVRALYVLCICGVVFVIIFNYLLVGCFCPRCDRMKACIKMGRMPVWQKAILFIIPICIMCGGIALVFISHFGSEPLFNSVNQNITNVTGEWDILVDTVDNYTKSAAISGNPRFKNLSTSFQAHINLTKKNFNYVKDNFRALYIGRTVLAYFTLALCLFTCVLSIVAASVKNKFVYYFFFWCAVGILFGAVGTIGALEAVRIVLNDICAEVQYRSGAFALFQADLQTNVDDFAVERNSSVYEYADTACKLIAAQSKNNPHKCCSSLGSIDCNADTFPYSFSNALVYDYISQSTFQLQTCATYCLDAQLKNFSATIYSLGFSVAQLDRLGLVVNSSVLFVAGADFRNSAFTYFCFNAEQIAELFAAAGSFIIAIFIMALLIMMIHPKKKLDDVDSD